MVCVVIVVDDPRRLLQPDRPLAVLRLPPHPKLPVGVGPEGVELVVAAVVGAVIAAVALDLDGGDGVDLAAGHRPNSANL